MFSIESFIKEEWGSQPLYFSNMRWSTSSAAASSTSISTNYFNQNVQGIYISQIWIKFTGTGETLTLTDNTTTKTVFTWENTIQQVALFDFKHIQRGESLTFTLTSTTVKFSLGHQLIFAKKERPLP